MEDNKDIETFVVKQIEYLPLTVASLKQATTRDAQLSKVFMYMQSDWPAVVGADLYKTVF